MRNIFVFSAIIILALSAFNGKKGIRNIYQNSDTPVVMLDTHKWYLTTIYKTNGNTQVLTRKAFISFNTADGKIGGNGSCNSFGGNLIVDSTHISLANIFSTKMYCTEVQSIENDFLSRLPKVTRYEIKDKKLLLFAEEALLLEFET